MEFTIPEDASPELKSFLENETNKAAVASLIEQAKAPITSKRDELLSKQVEFNKKIDALGGLERIESLAKQAAAAEEARKKAELEAVEKSGDLTKLKEHYGNQLADRERELNDLKASITQEKANAKIAAAIREANGVPDLLAPHVASRVRASMVDGKLELTVLAPNGVDMLTSDGKPASLKDLIGELRTSPIYQRAFEAPAAGGTGGKTSTTPSVNNPWNPATKNVTEQMRLYRQDKAAAQRMAAEFNITLR